MSPGKQAFYFFFIESHVSSQRSIITYRDRQLKRFLDQTVFAHVHNIHHSLYQTYGCVRDCGHFVFAHIHEFAFTVLCFTAYQRPLVPGCVSTCQAACLLLHGLVPVGLLNFQLNQRLLTLDAFYLYFCFEYSPHARHL